MWIVIVEFEVYSIDSEEFVLWLVVVDEGEVDLMMIVEFVSWLLVCRFKVLSLGFLVVGVFDNGMCILVVS